jgi:hypothetical protein
MAYSQHGDSLAVFDFKQGDVAVSAKADNQLAQQRIFRRNLAATKWKSAQKLHALGNGSACAPCSLHIPLCEKIKQALQISCSSRRKTDSIVHLRAAALRAFANDLSRPANISSTDT